MEAGAVNVMSGTICFWTSFLTVSKDSNSSCVSFGLLAANSNCKMLRRLYSLIRHKGSVGAHNVR